MGKKKLKRVKSAPKSKKKAIAPPRKSAAKKKKATPAGPKRASKPRAAATKKKKATPSKTRRAPQARKPVARKKAASPKKAPFSKALKDEISTALVTGARGCVGSLLIQQLLREGYSVIAADSKGPEIQALAGKSNRALRQGDLSDPAFAASCLEGVDAVFHPGIHADGKPLYGVPGPSPVHATRTLYRLAREERIKRFMLITSCSLYGRHHGPVNEETALEARDEYEQTQIEMESLVLEDPLPGLPSVTVIRPAWVYGPGCRASMACLATLPPLVRTLGPYYIPLSGGPRASLVHGDDVARAAVFLLLQPKAYGGVFNVADKDPMPFGHFLNEAMEAYGLRPLEPGVPYPPSTLLQSILPYDQTGEIFNPLGKLSNILWERLVRTHRLNKVLMAGKDQPALPLGRGDLVVDNRKLLGLGFRLKYPKFRRGWDKTLAWYQKNRWIPRPDEL
jgi:nucleoside-diphosphate-sugar epimerase